MMIVTVMMMSSKIQAPRALCKISSNKLHPFSRSSGHTDKQRIFSLFKKEVVVVPCKMCHFFGTQIFKIAVNGNEFC